MTVKKAKDDIKTIEDLCNKISHLDSELSESSYDTGFLLDVIAYLGDYERLLEREIDRAELKTLN